MHVPFAIPAVGKSFSTKFSRTLLTLRKVIPRRYPILRFYNIELFPHVSQEERHVGFDVDVDDEDDYPGERLNLRLQRRDTPHHLKNKRINDGTGDADTLKAILQRVRDRIGKKLHYIWNDYGH